MFAAYEPCMPGMLMKLGCVEDSAPKPINVQTAGASSVSTSVSQLFRSARHG